MKRCCHVYGWGLRDYAIREICDETRFGFLYVAHGADVDLAIFVDEECDPATVSINDVAVMFAEAFAGSANREDSSEGELSYLHDSFMDMSRRYVEKRLRDRSFRVDSEKDLEHVCGEGLTGIEPHPPISGTYFVRCGTRIKIGRSNNIAKRIKNEGSFSPYSLELLAFTENQADEKRLHKRFARYRVPSAGREWFDGQGSLLEYVFQVRLRQQKREQARQKKKRNAS